MHYSIPLLTLVTAVAAHSPASPDSPGSARSPRSLGRHEKLAKRVSLAHPLLSTLQCTC